MPSDLKPTTRDERERWKASAEYRTGPNDEIILRLIADHERLTAREAELEQALLAVEALIKEHRKRCPIAWMDSYDAQD